MWFIFRLHTNDSMRHHNFYDQLDDLNDVQMHSYIGSLGNAKVLIATINCMNDCFP